MSRTEMSQHNIKCNMRIMYVLYWGWLGCFFFFWGGGGGGRFTQIAKGYKQTA